MFLSKLFSFKRKDNKSTTGFTDINEHYEVGRQIGKGAFSVVREGTHKETGEKYAIKFVHKSFVSPKELKFLEREMEIMRKLEHKNIVQLIEVGESADDIFIVMELVPGGELFDHLIQKGYYSEKLASIIVRQLCEGVAFMHKNGIAHRDLKPQNLLCTPDGLTIKIADFGLSKMYANGEELKTACGTPDYVAPEIIACEPYTNAVDIWSVGIITYILLCGFTPFYADNHRELFEKIANAPLTFPMPEWSDISPQAKEFVMSCLEKDPRKRATAEALLKTEWLTGVIHEKKLARLESFKELLINYNTKRRNGRVDDSQGSSEDLLQGLNEK